MAVFLKTCPQADTALKHRAGCGLRETETGGVGEGLGGGVQEGGRETKRKRKG